LDYFISVGYDVCYFNTTIFLFFGQSPPYIHAQSSSYIYWEKGIIDDQRGCSNSDDVFPQLAGDDSGFIGNFGDRSVKR
jgi:hypothetical protein